MTEQAILSAREVRKSYREGPLAVDVLRGASLDVAPAEIRIGMTVRVDFEALSETRLEKQVIEEITELQECLKAVPASFIIVSNEVGLDIVPDNRLGRLYRDFLGRANQQLAQNADEVFFMVAGIPLRIKGENNSKQHKADQSTD